MRVVSKRTWQFFMASLLNYYHSGTDIREISPQPRKSEVGLSMS